MNEHERAYIRAQQSKFVARRYHFRGKRMTRAEVSRLTGWSNGAVASRIVGDTIEDRPVLSPAERRRKAAKRYLFRGQSLTVSEIAALIGMHPDTVYNRRSGNRVLEGDELESAYQELPSWATPITFRGKTNSISGWARELGIHPFVLWQRLNTRGWPVRRALTEPIMTPDQRVVYQGNRRTVRRIAFGFRRARNAEIIHRIARAHQTGGPSQTFDLPEGTGEDSSARDLHHEGTRA